jgi:hypothetical protein
VLVEAATRHDLVVRLVKRVGDHVVAGTPIAWAWQPSGDPAPWAPGLLGSARPPSRPMSSWYWQTGLLLLVVVIALGVAMWQRAAPSTSTAEPERSAVAGGGPA